MPCGASSPWRYKPYLSEMFFGCCFCPFWISASVSLALPFLRMKVPQTALTTFVIVYSATWQESLTVRARDSDLRPGESYVLNYKILGCKNPNQQSAAVLPQHSSKH